MTSQENRNGDVRVLFVRHGETAANVEHRYMGQTDSPLTPTGIVQAEVVAKRLGKAHVGIIYSSDLGRAARTSEIISQACGVPVAHDRRLRERHAGLLQGELATDARVKHAKIFAELEHVGPEYVFPSGGESGLQIEERIAGFLDDMRENHVGETVVAVTHGGVLCVLLWHILRFPYNAISRLRCDNTSISAFSFSDDRWVLDFWNDTAHL
ncbi:MAG: histidine phosphatase family protein [Candidatus Bipolaricaulota bacterium]|nr:histidine phosphatase family protein [Candidatus Bipolaricaulota bacterium]